MCANEWRVQFSVQTRHYRCTSLSHGHIQRSAHGRLRTSVLATVPCHQGVLQHNDAPPPFNVFQQLFLFSRFATGRISQLISGLWSGRKGCCSFEGRCSMAHQSTGFEGSDIHTALETFVNSGCKGHLLTPADQAPLCTVPSPLPSHLTSDVEQHGAVRSMDTSERSPRTSSWRAAGVEG